MKIASLSFSITGVLLIILSALTAVEILPGFIHKTSSFGQFCTTTFFWAGLSVLCFLAAYAFGSISRKELK